MERKELTNKERLAIPPQKMPEQDPKARIRNVNEVPIGYTAEQAIEEANRCLQCKNAPCVKGCPVEIDIPGFIRQITEGDFRGAINTIKITSVLPAVCGRVCPQEEQCQAPCTVGKSLKSVDRAVQIGKLERFVADREMAQGQSETPEIKPETGKKIAIIGCGPAGITVAADCRREGHRVTIFEALHKPGGVLAYGIPEFRLPKKIVGREVDNLVRMGVEVKTNMVIGKIATIDELMEEQGYDAVFVGTGAGLPMFLNIPGENLNGVYSANEYLTRANLMQAYSFPNTDTPIARSKNVAVFGGGNVAMDSARTALRLGADNVYLMYRRSREEMPARKEESTPRRGGRRADDVPPEPDPLHRQRKGLGHRRGMPPHGAWRAGRFGPPPARRGQGERIHDRGRHLHRGDRERVEPVDPPDLAGHHNHEMGQHHR